DPAAYEGLRLRPSTPAWVPPDSFGTALASLRASGQAVNAWIVVLHNTRLGEANPDLVIENAFGDRYTHALCPAQAEVRAYASALVADIARRYQVNALELEACGYMSVEHLSHHEKAGIQLDLLHRFLLSVCFCQACVTAMAAEGLDPDETRAAVRAACEAFLVGGMMPTDQPADVAARLAAVLGEDPADRLVRTRNKVTFELHDEIAAELGTKARGPNAPDMVISAGASVYDTGAAIGADPAGLAARADRLLMHLLTLADDEMEATTARMVEAVEGRTKVDIGVSVFAPATPDADRLAQRVRRLAAAGAQGIHYYHYGLCPRQNLGWIAQAAGGMA
ncbi:MAG TPA: hypothetical protein VE640_07770, partial [Candidatus Bathyarchaeia archaeon]|nr:hypothetical protein [Candidatus Bathyarchaeia archaeon]